MFRYANDRSQLWPDFFYDAGIFTSVDVFSLLACALLASVAVAFVGTIGFVGLVAPHIARLLLGEDQRFFLPGSILVGASLLSLASVLSKLVISGSVLPIGITTSLIGIPCFFILIFTIRQK